MHEPGAALSVGFNLERFNALTPTHQKALEIACAEAHQQNYALFTANNGPALQRLTAAGVSTHQFPDDVWDAFANGAAQVLGGYKGDPLYDTVFNSAMASMDATYGWLSLADAPYVQQRARVLSVVRG
jgi:TRAP-type mannitol/chloroaromatic compound transport system substrate-binding protein